MPKNRENLKLLEYTPIFFHESILKDASPTWDRETLKKTSERLARVLHAKGAKCPVPYLDRKDMMMKLDPKLMRQYNEDRREVCQLNQTLNIPCDADYLEYVNETEVKGERGEARRATPTRICAPHLDILDSTLNRLCTANNCILLTSTPVKTPAAGQRRRKSEDWRTQPMAVHVDTSTCRLKKGEERFSCVLRRIEDALLDVHVNIARQ